MTGRPRFLDDAKCREICALLSVGCRPDTAAFYVGCTVVTIRRELQRNPDFRQRYREAQVAARVGPLRALRSAAQTHWRAAAWLLERNYPQEFARRGAYSFTSADFKDHISRIFAIIQHELGADHDALHRIEAQLTWYLKDLDQEIEASNHPWEKKPQPRDSRQLQAQPPTTPPLRSRP